jgi:hypothetical protein
MKLDDLYIYMYMKLDNLYMYCYKQYQLIKFWHFYPGIVEDYCNLFVNIGVWFCSIKLELPVVYLTEIYIFSVHLQCFVCQQLVYCALFIKSLILYILKLNQ